MNWNKKDEDSLKTRKPPKGCVCPLEAIFWSPSLNLFS